MSDELRRNLERMLKEQTEKQLRSHQELAFIRDDYYRLPIESRGKLKEDMLAIREITERLERMHMGIEHRQVCYELSGQDGEANDVIAIHLELSPDLWLHAMKLWDETEHA